MSATPDDELPAAVIVAGPTCSGKSLLAMMLAERLGGIVINADSMQTYRELRILTARPSEADEARVPHRLYGVRSAGEPGDAAWWRRAALAELDAARTQGLVPILCGGTGLYFSALVDGLADIPEPGGAARAEARRLLATLGSAGLYAHLAERDPLTASQLNQGDSQRVARAWEVLTSTGRGLASWQQTKLPPAPWRFASVLLDPPRHLLRQRIADRIDAMIASGAVDEVRALLKLNLDPSLPAMRAHGVPELCTYIQGEISLATARQRIELITAQYTKRQATWFHHHPLAPERHAQTINAVFDHDAQFSESLVAYLKQFIHGSG